MTFAGSPDRAEARLVPEAGFELDTFRVSGLPRRPGLEQARAALRALAAPRRLRPDPRAAAAGRRARRRRLRRRADGRRRGAPADPGRADRGRRAPRPREPAGRAVRQARLPLVSDPGPRAAEVRRHGPADPGERSRRCRAPRRARSSGCPADGPVLLVAGARAGRAVAERAGGRGVRRRAGRPCCTSRGERDFDELRARVSRPDYVLLPVLDGLGAALRRGRPRADARAARRSGSSPPPACPRSSCPTRSRPPTTRRRTRATSRRPAARSSSPRRELGRVPEIGARRCSTTRPARGDERRDAQRRAARRGRARSRRS